jgi:hypothetical protein
MAKGKEAMLAFVKARNKRVTERRKGQIGYDKDGSKQGLGPQDWLRGIERFQISIC